MFKNLLKTLLTSGLVVVCLVLGTLTSAYAAKVNCHFEVGAGEYMQLTKQNRSSFIVSTIIKGNPEDYHQMLLRVTKERKINVGFLYSGILLAPEKLRAIQSTFSLFVPNDSSSSGYFEVLTPNNKSSSVAVTCN